MKTASLKYLTLFALLCVAGVFAQSSVEGIPEPFLVVSKRTSADDIVLGSSIEVVVEVFNQGQSPAYDVEVTDLLGDGTNKKTSAEVLPFGKTLVLRYTVTPKVLGNYPVGISRVTYNVEQGNSATRHTAMSNFIREGDAHFHSEGVDDESFRGVVSVLTRERYDRLHAKYIKETIAYLFLGLVPAFFPYVLYSLKRTEVDSLLRQSKKSKQSKTK